MSKIPNLGFLIVPFALDSKILQYVRECNWSEIDRYFGELTQMNGRLFQLLGEYAEFSSIEFIISVRDSGNSDEEDGIWHDDGGRVFAFSLSLTENARAIEGGKLGIRKKGDSDFTEIPTLEFGQMLLFLTGHDGFEHKIHRVTKGRRVVIAGWCS